MDLTPLPVFPRLSEWLLPAPTVPKRLRITLRGPEARVTLPAALAEKWFCPPSGRSERGCGAPIGGHADSTRPLGDTLPALLPSPLPWSQDHRLGKEGRASPPLSVPREKGGPRPAQQ